MIYDYSKLSGRIREKLGSQKAFAEEIGLSERSLSLKMQSKTGWKQREMAAACEALDIPLHEIHEYFFKKKKQPEAGNL